MGSELLVGVWVLNIGNNRNKMMLIVFIFL